MNFFDVNHYFHSGLGLGALPNEAKKQRWQKFLREGGETKCVESYGGIRRETDKLPLPNRRESRGNAHAFVRRLLHARFWWRIFGLQLLEARHFRLGFLELTLLAVNLAEKVVCGGPVRVNRKGGFQFFLRLRKAIQIHHSFAECFVRANVARSDRHGLLKNG